MSKKLICLCAAVLMAVPGNVLAAQAMGPQSAARIAVGLRDWSLSGPYTHKNLTVYLVHGPDLLHGRSFLTLQEALEQKKARVYETGNVNELAIENLSDKEELFVQAGEIVRGGKQDRVLAVDLIIKPGSGKVSIGAFCVEAGRWTQRGTESAMMFCVSNKMAPTNELKTAVIKGGNQRRVWSSVAAAQRALDMNADGPVTDPTSPTSLQLSLEQGVVRKGTSEYVDALSKALQGAKDGIGIVVAIDGEIYNADIYSSHQLFGKLLPKLLESSATAALTQQQKEKATALPTLDDVQSVLVAAEDAKVTEKQVSADMRIVTRESAGWLVTESANGEMAHSRDALLGAKHDRDHGMFESNGRYTAMLYRD